MPLLEGLDGVQKMSKSLGNYIGVNESPNEIYGKAMSVPDELMLRYYELATDISNEELEALRSGLADGSIHPRDAKMNLAKTLVRMFHGQEAAQEAEDYLQDRLPAAPCRPIFRRSPSICRPTKTGKRTSSTSLSTCSSPDSKGEARRMVQQGAVKVNEEKVDDINQSVKLTDGMVVQVGKRKFAKVKLG